MDELANSMGLFLQKTNVTRDYLEDVTAVNPRIFYPKDIWYHDLACVVRVCVRVCVVCVV
jgi:phytoene/squalene synthetase